MEGPVLRVRREGVLAISGFAMVAVFMTLIMTKRLTPLALLVVVPVVTALLLGFSPAEIGEMAMEGIGALRRQA